MLKLKHFGKQIRNTYLNCLNVVLERDGEDQLEQSYEKWRSVTKSQLEKENPTNNKKKRKANWFSRILLRNCLKNTLLKESNTEGKKRWEDEEEDLSG
jgi:hypothetical protein